ncbi:Chromosome (plasmid) partitioning protein ParA [hydrothermal vent metagenome]|uniref:Chromosome (Plasmid) partitioning protein ParA n=1 Tax=hydrothermal vent metagenome TaxID=652676 RepID=A0A3B1CFJ9_9ZZZZ
MPARTIAIVNRKGGSGKTTTAVNLSAGLALRDERVLLIDIDPQANASLHLGVDVDNVNLTIYELLLGMEPDIKKAMVETKVKNLHLIPSALRLAGAEEELVPVSGRESLLKNIVEQIACDYTYLIVDCPVSFGILSLNALLACDEALVPAQTHYLSVFAVRQVMDIIGQVNETFGHDMKIVGIIPTMMDRRSKLNAELVKDMEKEYGRNLLRPTVRLDAKLAEAPAKGRPIQLTAPKSNGAYDYTALADDLRMM